MVKSGTSLKVIKRTRGVSLGKRVGAGPSDPCLVRVGVLSGAGVHPGSNSATYAEIAYWLEYGTENGPEFRFLRGWLQEKGSEYRRTIEKLVRDFLLGDANWSKVRGALGLTAQKDLRAYMENLTEPSNSAATQRRKGAKTGVPGAMIDNPLIDTGKLRAVISWGGGS